MTLAQSSAVFRPFVRVQVDPVIRMTEVGSVSVAPPAGLQSAPDNSTGYVCGALKAGENLTRCISAPVYQEMSASTPCVTVTDPYNPAEVQVKINDLFKGGLVGMQARKRKAAGSCDRVFHHSCLGRRPEAAQDNKWMTKQRGWDSDDSTLVAKDIRHHCCLCMKCGHCMD